MLFLSKYYGEYPKFKESTGDEDFDISFMYLYGSYIDDWFYLCSDLDLFGRVLLSNLFDCAYWY